ncbi:putative protein involved in outer membrane biogenesis [Cesiribacter andamanensis AMV16]|uniref:Translocation and assembly module TamB C-terminal domain-containing protein n=1 Tax=Cesiribacter andamanensis AMV16 TaxID=1279009 RepID=M7N366_9BACT|nr:putative protein involved in outer membrane biogenesis [Cesiribacter andamanensis AMV16]
MLIQIPAVQTKVTQKVANSFAEQWGTEVRIDKVNLRFFDSASLQGIFISDKAGDTLVWASSLTADIGAFAILDSRLELDEIALEGAYINLYRHQDSANFNYQFIVDSFVSQDTLADTTSSAFIFDLYQVRLQDVRLRYADDSSKMSLNVHAPYLLTELETLGLPEQFVKISNIDIRDLRGGFTYITPSPVKDTLATADEVAQELDSAMLNPSGFRIAVEKFAIKNTQFHYQASELAEKGTLNFQNLDLRTLNVGINDFYLAGDTLRLDVQQLAAIEQNSGFVLDNFAMAAAIELPMVSGSLTELRTPNTRLTDPIRLEQLSIKPGADMLASLQLSANVQGAVLGMEDAAYFTPALDTMPYLRSRTFILDLTADVENNKANISPLRLRTEDGGMLMNMAGTITGLNDLENMRFDLQLRELSTTVAYLQRFSFMPEFPPAAAQAGRLHLIADAKGTPKNMDIAARLRSGMGLLQTNMLYRAPTANRFLLAGNVDATDFDLTPFVGDSLGLGTITLTSKLRVNGIGQQINVDNFSLIVEELEYNDHLYKGLAAQGYFVDSTLEVSAAYEDAYLDMDLFLKTDMKDSLPLLQAELNLDRLNMYRLNLSPDSVIISTRLVADVRGNDFDGIRGTIEARDTELIRGANKWTMDSLVVSSREQGDGTREIALTTDFASATLTGQYLLADLQQALDQCANHYCSAYKPGDERVEFGQDLELAIKMWDEPIIAKAFLPQLELLHPMTINARFRDRDRSFDLEVEAPGISWDTLVIENLQVDAKTVDQVLSFDIDMDKLKVGTTTDIPSFRLDGQWVQDSVHFVLGLAPETDSTRLLLGGAVTFYNDTLALALDQTELAIRGKEYQMADNALIKYATDFLQIRDFALQREGQLLAVNTRNEYSQDPLLLAQINEFQIGDFADIFGFQEYGLAATLDGKVQLTNPMNLSAMEADLLVQNLMVDSLPVGNLQLQMNKVSNDGRLNADIALKGPGNDLSMQGFLNMEDSTNAMQLDVDINSFALAPWEPFVKDFLQDLEGSLQGNMDIAGSLNQPRMEGQLNFGNNSAFRLAMTGARYTLQDEGIAIDNQAIRLNEFTLLDSLNQTLVVDGQIRHNAFQDFRLDLSAKAQDFQVVNKARSLQELFYGRLYVRTDARITGPLDDILVSGSLRVNEKTDFALVIQSEDANAGVASFINFINTNAFLAADTTFAMQLQAADSLDDQLDAAYFSVNLDIEVPPAATFTVVVDPTTGDFLEVRGTADLQFRMDPSGDMNLQGLYEVEEGRYRLSFMEVIQKSFAIQEGSTVAFTGDPFDAQMEITAVYTTEASRLPLLPNAEPGTPEYAAARRKEPVNVLLNMAGTLESPVISFNILVPESNYGEMGSAVSAQLDQIKSNESELFRQVFGLIVLNRFLAEDPLAGGGDGGGAGAAVNAQINQSVGSFLTEQLNAVTQDYLGVEIEIELESNQMGGGNASLGDSRDIGVNLSRSLFNDRVEVQVGGVTSTGGGGGTGPGAGGSGFAGNFAILYHINEKGNLSLKIFQRNDRDYLTNEFIPKTGAAISFFKHFNTMSGLFGSEPSHLEMLKSDGAVETELNKP